MSDPVGANPFHRVHLALACAALALVVVAIYVPALGSGFLFDDFTNIVENSRLHVSTLNWADWASAAFSSPSSSLQRPLAMLSFALNHFLTGLDPWPMKVTNLFIHVLNALLVLSLSLRLVVPSSIGTSADATRTAQNAALFIAAAWAVNPINFTAVSLVVQRMELLSHTFVFAGLWMYICARQRQLSGVPGWWGVILSLTVFPAAGALAKESAVLLPLFALCLELTVFRFRTRHSDHADPAFRWVFGLLLVVPALLALAWLYPRTLAPGQYAGRDFTLTDRLLTESRVVLSYLQWTVVPSLGDMGLYHDDLLVSRGILRPVSTLYSVLLLGAISAFAWIGRTRRPLLSLGLLWFLSGHVMTATIIPLELMFEHRNYFSSLGVCLVLADLIYFSGFALRHRFLSVILGSVLVLLYAGATWSRSLEWESPLRFALSEAGKHPKSPRASYEKARALAILVDGDRTSPYLPEAMSAIDAAHAVPGSNALPAQLGLVLAARTGQAPRPDLWDGLAAKLAEQPVGPQPLAALSSMVACSNSGGCKFPAQDMLRVFGAAMSRGENAELCNIYGNYALNSLDDTELALRLWREAVRLNPEQPQYRINLARLLIVLRRDREASEEISELRRIGRLGQHESIARGLEQKLIDRKTHDAAAGASNWAPSP